MDEEIMGKIFCKNITVTLCLLIAVYCFSGSALADMQEAELFEKAYEYYLAFQPDKAIETFDLFLKRFPDSSAMDSVLFWRAKSLIQLKRADEAAAGFRKLREVFPDSSYSVFAEKELETLKNRQHKIEKSDAVREKSAKPADAHVPAHEDRIKKLEAEKIDLERQLSDAEKKRQLIEKGLSRALDDKNSLESQLEDSRKKQEELAKLSALNEKEMVKLRTEKAAMESELKMARKALAAMKANEDQAMILAEVDQLKAQKQQMQTELAEIKRTNEQHASRNAELVRDVSDLRARTLDIEKPFLRIGKEQYSLAAIINEGRTARNVTEKIQVKNVPWRIGNIIDVFIAEQILAHKAQEEMLAVDKAVKEALVKQYVLSAEEGAYLEKYLTIDSLVKKRFASPVIAEKEAREYYEKHKDQYTHGREKRIRVLSVKYGKTDELEKSLLAVEMQQEAQEGRPFDAIANKRSTATMKEMSLSRLPDWARAKLAGLKEGEISNIISADNEFMIIQPIPSKPTFRSFEEVRREIEKKLSAEQSGKKESFAKWFESLKKDAEFLLY